MKTKAILLAGLFLIFGAAQAQEIFEPAVKILPTSEKGILKVLYAYHTGQSVSVKFFNNDGVLLSDRIKAKTFLNGFSKKYDVRMIGSKDFFVEVSSAKVSVVYRMTESKDRKEFIPVLEKATYMNPKVASSN
jgi:hypothetical protein